MIELEVGSDLRRRLAAHHAEEGDSNADGGFDSKVLSVEQIFEGKVVPSWKDEMTFRAFVVSLVLGFFFGFSVMKLNLGAAGVLPGEDVDEDGGQDPLAGVEAAVYSAGEYGDSDLRRGVLWHRVQRHVLTACPCNA